MKNKTKRIIASICAAGCLIAGCFYIGLFGQHADELLLNRIVGFVAIVSGIGSILIGLSSITSASLDNVREYYATGDTPELAQARQVLYHYRYVKMKYNKCLYDDDFDEWVSALPDDHTPIQKYSKADILRAASAVINFFQMWGLLQRKGFLPIWVFETASGYSVIKLYEAVEDILRHKQTTNMFYGVQFQQLCVRIGIEYKKAIRQCRDAERQYIIDELHTDDPDACPCFNIHLK